MSGNTFGKIFKVTTFGESHGQALGCIIDGIPAGLKIDTDKVQQALDRRKPGQSSNGSNNACVTSRKEDDKAQFLSGIFEGKATGTPVSVVIFNTSQHSSDYGNLVNTFRPGHADFTYNEKYSFRDYRGGGRSSGRETCARVAAGEIARQILTHFCPDLKITAYTQRAAGISIQKVDFAEIEQNSLRAPDNETAKLMEEKIQLLRSEGESVGGIVACKVTGLPAGLGECIFDKLDAVLAHAILSIGSIKGIEFGSGFDTADFTGSQNNDVMKASDDHKSVIFETNNCGGVLGGISTGSELYFRAAVKPVPSIYKEQKTVKLDENNNFVDTTLQIKGRHDICLCPRIVPVVEAMTAITLCDLFLQNLSAKI